MTRRDLKTLAWLAPLGVLLSLWWIFRSSPCLDNHLGNQWRQWFPSPPVVSAPSEDPDAVVIENPYGIEACDFWPEPSDDVITVLLWLLITGLIGFLSARTLEQHPAKRAAWITGAGQGVGFALSNLAYLPGLLREVHVLGYCPAASEIMFSIAFVIVGASLSALAAWLTLRWRPRITTK